MTVEPLSTLLGRSNIESLKYVREIVGSQANRERLAHGYWIDALLTGQSAYAVQQVILRACKDDSNRAELTELLRWAESDTVFQRTIEELSCVYSEPPVRTVRSGQTKFDQLAEDVQLDAVMTVANQRFNAHCALWIAPRVRHGEMIVDVITPACFSVVWPEDDPTYVAALVFDLPKPLKPDPDAPVYRIVARDATYWVNEKFELVHADENVLGELPGVLVTAAPPSATGWILPPRPNHDLCQADAAASFHRLMGLRESLTVKKQVAIAGDMSSAVFGQTQASAKELILPEGVVASVLDRGVDAMQYLQLAESVGNAAASNRGVSSELRRQAPVDSGWAMQLRRLPLLERRRLQVSTFRRAETHLARLMSRVADLTGLERYAFNPDAFAIEFGALQAPVDEMTELQTFELARRLGLTDTVQELAKKAQISDDEAAHDIATHAEREAARLAMLQGLARRDLNGGPTIGDSSNVGQAGAPVIASNSNGVSK